MAEKNTIIPNIEGLISDIAQPGGNGDVEVDPKYTKYRTYILINNSNKCITYYCNAYTHALNSYIKNKVKYNSYRFKLDENTYTSFLADADNDIDIDGDGTPDAKYTNEVETNVFNTLCTSAKYHIKYCAYSHYVVYSVMEDLTDNTNDKQAKAILDTYIAENINDIQLDEKHVSKWLFINNSGKAFIYTDDDISLYEATVRYLADIGLSFDSEDFRATQELWEKVNEFKLGNNRLAVVTAFNALLKKRANRLALVAIDPEPIYPGT